MPKLVEKKNEDAGVTPRSAKERKTDAEKSVQKAAKPPKKTETAKKAVVKKEDKGPDLMNRARQYLREVVFEMRKVVWPTRKETLGTTAVVLVIVLICGIFLGFVDYILTDLIRLILG